MKDGGEGKGTRGGLGMPWPQLLKVGFFILICFTSSFFLTLNRQKRLALLFGELDFSRGDLVEEKLNDLFLVLVKECLLLCLLLCNLVDQCLDGCITLTSNLEFFLLELGLFLLLQFLVFTFGISFCLLDLLASLLFSLLDFLGDSCFSFKERVEDVGHGYSVGLVKLDGKW